MAARQPSVQPSVQPTIQPTVQPTPPTKFSTTDLAMLVVVLIWGLNFVVVKATLAQIQPLVFNGIRFTLAALLSAGVAHSRGLSLLPKARGDILPLILLGLGGHAVYQLAFVNGIDRTTASSSSLILATVPIWVALYGSLTGTERVGRRWLGIILGFVGLVALIVGQDGFHLGSATLSGDLLILICAWGWAWYTVAQKPLLGRYAPLEITSITMLIGAPILVVAGLSQLPAQNWAGVTWAGWGGIFFSAVFGVALAYLIWSTAVQRIGNTRTAVYSNLIPVVATITAWLTLGEQMATVQLLGAAVVILGIWLTRRLR